MLQVKVAEPIAASRETGISPEAYELIKDMYVTLSLRSLLDYLHLRSRCPKSIPSELRTENLVQIVTKTE